jgi:hypothetical protein
LASHIVHHTPFSDKSGLARSALASFCAGVVSNRTMTSQEPVA